MYICMCVCIYMHVYTCMYTHACIHIHVCVCMFSHLNCVLLFATPWTIAHQAPLSMGFSRQESWHALPCPSPGILHNLGIEPVSPVYPIL